MSLRAYVPIDKQNLPDRFEFPFGESNFILRVDYNKSQDFFTIDIFTIADEPIVLGEVMRLNERLWADIIDERLPSIDLVPMDESGLEKTITFENFCKSVFLYLDDLPPNFESPVLEGDADG